MATAKKASAKKSLPRKAAPKKSTSKQPVNKKTIAKKAAPKRSVPTSSGKTATKRSVPRSSGKVAAPAWNTIHIFGYGESQVIGPKANGKVANKDLKSLAPLFVSLAKKQQKGTKIDIGDTHALNIFNGSFVDYRPKPASKNKSQRLAWSDIDKKAVNKLADELINKIPKEKTHAEFMQLFMNGGGSAPRKTVLARTKKNTTAKAK